MIGKLLCVCKESGIETLTKNGEKLKQTVLLPTPKEDILDMETSFLSTIEQYFTKDAWMAFEQKFKQNVGRLL